MAHEIINPGTLFDTTGFGFSHIALQNGGKLVHIAGQTAWDKERNLVGGDDLREQTKVCLENLRKALEAVGGTPANIVRLRTYVVNPGPDAVMVVCDEINKFYGSATPAPNTFLGISALAMPEFKIEIEATAAID